MAELGIPLDEIVEVSVIIPLGDVDRTREN